MKPTQSDWINSVLHSVDGMNRAEPQPFLYAKIRDRLTQRPAVKPLPRQTAWLAAASFAALLLLNWRIVAQTTGTRESANNSDLQQLVSAMQLYPTANSLYDQ